MRKKSSLPERPAAGGRKGVGFMKKLAVYAAVALIPVLFFANVWQSFRYSSLKREIARLESVQQDLLEMNKRSIAGC